VTGPGARRGLLDVYRRRILTQGVGSSIARAVRHPTRSFRHVRRLLAGDVVGLSNRYGPAPRNAGVTLVAAVLGLERAAADAAFRELDDDRAFTESLRDRYARLRPEWVSSFDPGRFTIVYALVRLTTPVTVLETGVHDGLSTALILRALERNGSGRLTSIDLPSTDLPIGAAGPGWLVPERLRTRWMLRLGDSRQLLPSTAAQLAPIDLFLHDSDHSPSHREFEFRTVRSHLAEDGLIVSDDDEPTDGVLDELAAEWSLVHRTSHDPGGAGPVVGVLSRRPAESTEVRRAVPG
jgi:predicted O-methyltransferase YrrM